MWHYWESRNTHRILVEKPQRQRASGGPWGNSEKEIGRVGWIGLGQVAASCGYDGTSGEGGAGVCLLRHKYTKAVLTNVRITSAIVCACKTQHKSKKNRRNNLKLM